MTTPPPDDGRAIMNNMPAWEPASSTSEARELQRQGLLPLQSDGRDDTPSTSDDLVTTSSPQSAFPTPTTVPTPSSVPSYHRLPPEILNMVFTFFAGDESEIDFMARNRRLVTCAMVSKAFKPAAYSSIYQNLRLSWQAGNITLLLETFMSDPTLPLIIRRLEATHVEKSDWVTDNWINSDPAAQEFLDFCQAEGIEDGRRATLWEEPIWEEGAPLDMRDQWLDMRRRWQANVRQRLEDKRVAIGNAGWDDKYGEETWEHRIFGVLDLTTNVHTLVLNGFDATTHYTMTGHGPYPSIRSLHLNDNCAQYTGSFGSDLASRLPSLHHLTWKTHSDSDDKLPDVLRCLTPGSLRTLHVDVEDTVGLWAAAIIPYLPGLTSLGFNIRNASLLSEAEAEAGYSLSLEEVAVALSPSTSLLCLIVFSNFRLSYPDKLLSLLPSSLTSLVLGFDPPEGRSTNEEFHTILEELSRRKRRPLHLQMVMSEDKRPGFFNEAGSAALRLPEVDQRKGALAWVERFATEGITLEFCE
ncbi:hypothetical protein P7C70_g3337, partial [Phenoliferia sp. Uapishka_3]